ncbi:AraC-like DNA-binding protein [Catalinimonas alkaloidigena]|uniref:AraC family transcriptional regulator n=1 Tax=Catalinimonas alkaloidigena TaxID=1075417 RepID=UPI00240622F4|nr:AraC family transcriptional regulator [Catalinimonas alkaloidigena]MDF9796517.1 AraC-like DNA-binding protein [Catalinimonas alkaloidigena]
MSFVSLSIYQKAIHLSQEEGLSPNLLKHQLRRKEIMCGDKYIPMELLLEVYELADQHLKPAFGLRQGKQLTADDYGTLGLSWKTCWRAKDVLDRAERYMILVTDHGEARIEEANGTTKLKLIRDAQRKGIETANEATFVMLSGIMREVTNKEIYPVGVCFKHTIEEAKPFVDFFRCPVRFGQEENAIQFSTSAIDIPTVKADKSIHRFLLERLDEEKKGIYANADRLLGELYKLIEEALPSGIPSVIQMAEYLGMSARTLKRRLAEKGLSFRELVQNIQREVAVALLRNSRQSISEIAFLTGFSEQSAFNRAFKRWLGQSPADYRKNL